MRSLLNSASFASACLTFTAMCTSTTGVSAESPWYEVIALGRLETPGRFNFHPANAINNSGVVTGFSWLNTTDDFLAHAWRWNGSGPIVDIGTAFPGGSSGNAVNDAGIVAGNFTPDGTNSSIFTHPPGGPVQTYANGNIGPFSAVYGINNEHQIVGQWTAPDESYTAPFMFTEAGGVSVIGNFGDTPTTKTNGSAEDINEAGVIVGWSDRADGTRHAFRYVGAGDLNPALMSDGGDDLGTISTGTLAQAHAINEAGVIVGRAQISEDGPSLPMIWDDTNGMQSLGTLGGANGHAFDINAGNQVVGFTTVTPGETAFSDIQAFIWDADNGIRNLNELIPADAGLLLESAYGINDSGWIVGEAMELATGFRTPYVLTPVPEPSSILLLAGAGLFAKRLRQPRRGRTDVFCRNQLNQCGRRCISCTSNS